MKSLQSENSFVEKIPVEGLEMADVEDDAVTLCNGPLVQGIRLDDGE